MTPTLLAVLATYAVHSLVISGLALVGVTVARGRGLAPASRVAVLRVALFGPLVTTLVALSNPLGGAAPLARMGAAAPGAVIGLSGSRAVGSPVSPGRGPVGADAADPATPGTPGRRDGNPLGGPLLLALLVAGGAALIGSARLLRAELRSRRRLASRQPLDPAATGLRVPSAADVKVSTCRGIHSPLALGRAEIVLPERLLEALSPEEREALFAHELAHLARRDPLWLGAARCFLALTWAHPLHHLIVGRMEHETELAADAHAVAATGRPLALARCLERACRWQRAAFEPAVAAGIGRVGRPLVRRVEALCASPGTAAPPRARQAAALSGAVLAVVACAGPAVQPTGELESGDAPSSAIVQGDWGPDGPFRRTPYRGDDAEPGEQRFWLDLNKNGGLARLPKEGLVTSNDVLDVLRAKMRRGSVASGAAGPSLDVLTDRVVVVIPGEVSFHYVLAWFQNFARDSVRAYKTEVVLTGGDSADVVSVFLPTGDVDVPIEEEEVEDEEAEDAAPRPLSDRAEIRIEGPEGRVHLRFEGEVAIHSDWTPGEFPGAIVSRNGPFVLSVGPDVPASAVMPVLRELVRGGVDFVFQGALIEPAVGMEAR